MREAKYTQALPVYVTATVRERIEKIATDCRVSLAEVIRDIIDHGIDGAEARWAGRS